MELLYLPNSAKRPEEARNQEGSPGKQWTSKKWKLWVQRQGPWSRGLGIPPPYPPPHPMRNRIPPFQGRGASLGPASQRCPPLGCEGHVGLSGFQDFLVPPLAQPQIPPKNESASEAKHPPAPRRPATRFSPARPAGLVRFSPVLDSVGNGRVHR